MNYFYIIISLIIIVIMLKNKEEQSNFSSNCVTQLELLNNIWDNVNFRDEILTFFNNKQKKFLLDAKRVKLSGREISEKFRGQFCKNW